ncbi:uncharacterized protein LOC100846193 [Brachypodium distachyon]|uniref:RING-CH-type domain-containing protein n=1 Tax=Brachypodium distachyon TaxID=15368 RepID=A0A0Q3G0D6_BRADI|nr:uncharacterized protein LOC100846193 [Brachypodium distachyon]KQK05007.1 hypothetical protein BRADI_2g17337v3 [Brachypodium distachyon]|eukprot:XP_003565947.2 uncharacterized protein LOC100846193 [Brachypodium distachyon]
MMMADHFAVMAGRLLTASTVQSAINEASTTPSSSSSSSSSSPATFTASMCDEETVEQGVRPRSGVLVECRICQEEGDETSMEAPCSCKGSLKYAHRKCVQRWCDEKGDTICEICLQQFTPNYTVPSKLFHHGRNSIFFRTPGYIQAEASTSYEYDHQSSSIKKGVICCRIIAITLMLLLVLHDAISVFLGDHEAYTVALITLLMLRTAGIVIPVYIILVSVTELLHRRNQMQVVRGEISEPVGGAGSRQPPVPTPTPPPPAQQQLVVIRIQ